MAKQASISKDLRDMRWLKEVGRGTAEFYFDTVARLVKDLNLSPDDPRFAFKYASSGNCPHVLVLERMVLALREPKNPILNIVLPAGSAEKFPFLRPIADGPFKRGANDVFRSLPLQGSSETLRQQVDQFWPDVIASSKLHLTTARRSVFRYLHRTDLFLIAMDADIRKQAFDHVFDGRGEWPAALQPRPVNYWLFQCNPSKFDIAGAIKEGALRSWRVTSHANRIRPGDKVIFWVSGPRSGCYALGRIDSDVQERDHDPNETRFYANPEESKPGARVGIAIEHDFSLAPILSERILKVEGMEDFNGGSQGTNFNATEAQYEAILAEASAMSDSDAIPNGTSVWKLGCFWDNGPSFYEFIKHRSVVVSVAEFEYRPADLVLVTEGFKVLAIARTTGPMVPITDHPNLRDECERLRIPFEPSVTIAPAEYYHLPQELRFECKIQAGIRKVQQEEVRSRTIQLWKHRNIRIQAPPRNIIHYGPPGTGKTYSLKEKYFREYTTQSSDQTSDERRRDFFLALDWWEVIAVALMELGPSKVGRIATHEAVVSKARAQNRTKGVTQTIWGALQSHAFEDCEFVKTEKRMDPLVFHKSADSVWEVKVDREPELLESLKSRYAEGPNGNTIGTKELRRFTFVTFHQSFCYEDFIEGIKPVLDTDTISYEIVPGVFKELCRQAQDDPDRRYAIFIDEINRGNVSAIFGELISLIEIDKRDGMENGLATTLPYSKERFSVPKNVDIIGTMNTADRSVEALDTALRRRFSFVEFPSRPDLLASEVVKGVALSDILRVINARIEMLLDRDHQIGHSFFMGCATGPDPERRLREIFKANVIPLLQEYFYGDPTKIALVVGPEFVAPASDRPVTFAKGVQGAEDIEAKPRFTFADPLAKSPSGDWTIGFDAFKRMSLG